MVSAGRRRKVRKRRSPSENSRMKIVIIAGMVLLAVLLGYLTARFVIGPIIGYDSEKSPVTLFGGDEDKDEKVDESSEEDGDETESSVEKDNEKTTGGTELETKKGYALQFGAFSTKEAADELSSKLKEKGINTSVVEIDNVFKVISPIIEKKEDAIKSLESLEGKEVEDVFIATFD